MNIQHTDPQPGARAVLGVATILYPATNYTPYADGLVEVIVEFNSASGNMQSGYTAVIEIDDASADDYEVRGNPSRPFEVFSNPKQGLATFYIAVHSDATTDLKFTVKPGNGVNFPAVTSQVYALSLTKLNLVYTDPDPLYLKTDAAYFPPFDGNTPPHYYAKYTVTVTDERNNPITDYIVEWGQAWDTSLFNRVYTYGANRNNALTVDYLNYRDQKKGVVRSKTDGNGVATLYIASQLKKGTYFRLTTAPLSAPHTFTPVSIIGSTSLSQPAPFLGLTDDDLNSVVGSTIGVGVTTPDNAGVGDLLTYILFINDEEVAIQTYNLTNESIKPTYLIFVPKGDFKTVENSDGRNTAYYSVGSIGGGQITSEMLRQTLKGSPGPNDPDFNKPRYLEGPFIEDVGDYITPDKINDGIVCKIRLYPQPPYWTEIKTTDKVQGTLWPHGWDHITGEARGKPIPVAFEITDEAIRRGYAEKTLNKTLLENFGPEPFLGTKGYVFFDAEVTVTGSPEVLYTDINKYQLQT